MNITTVMLPDACTAIDSTAFTGCSALTRICQKTPNGEIAKFCTDNGYTYCNLSGNAHTVAAE